MELNNVTNDVLNVIDSYGFKQEGAYNLRLNGMAVCHGDSRHIQIVKKEDQPGIDIHISGEAKNEQVHIPVVMTEAGVDVVYNDFYIEDGADVTIRSVAKGTSVQVFHPRAIGENPCHAHVQCDSIIMDQAEISSIPEINAKHVDAQIVHEAAIGRINDEQLIKLRTFGLSEEEAESVIIENFLK